MSYIIHDIITYICRHPDIIFKHLTPEQFYSLRIGFKFDVRICIKKYLRSSMQLQYNDM